MSEKNRDLLSVYIIILCSVILYANALTIPIKIPGELGSAFLPKLVLSGIIAMCLVKLFFVLFNNNDSYKKKYIKSKSLTKGLLTILILFIYVLLFQKLGFILSSVIYLATQFFILTDRGKRNNKLLILLSVATPVTIYTIFVNVMNLYLPVGLIGW